MAKKAKNSQLTRHTHKGRTASTNNNSRIQAQGGRGIRATGIRGDARETAAAMTRISPTPQGPERHWPGGA